MSKDEMISEIYDAIRDADLKTVEQVYWFLMEELKN
jgi:hypothetical protein